MTSKHTTGDMKTLTEKFEEILNRILTEEQMGEKIQINKEFLQAVKERDQEVLGEETRELEQCNGNFICRNEKDGKCQGHVNPFNEASNYTRSEIAKRMEELL